MRVAVRVPEVAHTIGGLRNTSDADSPADETFVAQQAKPERQSETR